MTTVKTGLGFNNILRIYSVEGTIKKQLVEQPNLVVTSGLNIIRDFLASGTYEPIMKMAIGGNSTAPAITDTALWNELKRGFIIKRTIDTAKVTLEYLLDVTQLNGETLREAGLLSESGLLFARVVHDDIHKTSSVQLLYSWTINISGA